MFCRLRCRGVSPSRQREFGSAPASSSIFTASNCPASAARWSGVSKSWSRALGFEPCANSRFSSLIWPRTAAWCRGVVICFHYSGRIFRIAGATNGRRMSCSRWNGTWKPFVGGHSLEATAILTAFRSGGEQDIGVGTSLQPVPVLLRPVHQPPLRANHPLRMGQVEIFRRRIAPAAPASLRRVDAGNS